MKVLLCLLILLAVLAVSGVKVYSRNNCPAADSSSTLEDFCKSAKCILEGSIHLQPEHWAKYRRKCGHLHL